MIPDEPEDFDAISKRSRTDLDLADFLGEVARRGIGLHVPDCRLTWEGKSARAWTAQGIVIKIRRGGSGSVGGSWRCHGEAGRAGGFDEGLVVGEKDVHCCAEV